MRFAFLLTLLPLLLRAYVYHAQSSDGLCLLNANVEAGQAEVLVQLTNIFPELEFLFTTKKTVTMEQFSYQQDIQLVWSLQYRAIMHIKAPKVAQNKYMDLQFKNNLEVFNVYLDMSADLRSSSIQYSVSLSNGFMRAGRIQVDASVLQQIAAFEPSIRYDSDSLLRIELKQLM
ncbi:hypothetical protein MP228_001182 [Amoeboaphelidium protococcarum]|nr:hypothetical protein MP228_001182 [Amoeboaphelidium protococcarum]